ncbi:MAG: glycosyltransferase [Verrucomicrobia bacterium]|nr:glycosyltransferase [Verrucomicrobiota bacterium]
MSATSQPGGILLVIPAWCETVRLNAFASRLFPALAASGLPVTVQIVDDGSPAHLAEALAERCSAWRAQFPFVQPLHRLPANIGKGGAIYAGWDLAGEAAWLAFCDADGSVDADEVVRILNTALTSPDPVCYCASRHIQGAQTHWGSILRQVLSHLFAAWVRWHTRLPLRDSQCGAKVIPRAIYRGAKGRLSEKRYAFDVELMLACFRAGVAIQEIPVRWSWQPGSRIKLARDGFSMLCAVRRIGRTRIRTAF